MTSSRKRHFIGIGSNVNPGENIVSILDELVTMAGCLLVSSIIRTVPEGINSDQKFLNLCVAIESEYPLRELKKKTNAIEQKLGRNRNDPNRKYKDRPADLDILLSTQLEDTWLEDNCSLPKEYYALIPLLELLDFLEYRYINLHSSYELKYSLERVPLQYNGVTLGTHPVSIACG